MELRTLALYDKLAKGGDSVKVSALAPERYVLGEARERIVTEIVEQMLEAQFWDPSYQAWLPFIDRYMRSGANPNFTLKYGEVLIKEDDVLVSPQTKYSEIIEEFTRMHAGFSQVRIPFEDMYWEDISAFLEIGSGWFDSMKGLRKIVCSEETFISSISELQKDKSWGSLALRCYIYRNPGEFRGIWPNKEEFQAELDNWVKQYRDSFEQARLTVNDDTEAFYWYNSKVRDLISNAWSRLMREDYMQGLITMETVYGMSPALSEAVTISVNNQPGTIESITARNSTMVWDALYRAIYEPTSPMMSRALLFTLPWRAIKNMLSKVNDWAWTVKDGFFINDLVRIRKLQFEEKGLSQDAVKRAVDGYIDDLGRRGFPVEGITL